MSKSIALIAPAHSYRASVYLKAAEKCNISVVFISDGQCDVVPGIISGIRVDFSNLNEAKQILSDRLTDQVVQAVITPEERYVAFAAEIAALLDLPHNSADALSTVSNKYLAKLKLKQAGIAAIPDFRLINLKTKIDHQLTDIEYPCVAKPLNLSASRGVIRADDRSELTAALARIQRVLHSEFENPDPLEAIVEEYVDGTEHALEGYLSDGELEVICIFDKPDPLTGPYFEETYYVTPSRLSESVQEEIRKTVLAGIIAQDLKMGPIHAEVRVSAGKVWIMEIAARSIGGDCGRIFELATHSSLEEFVIRRAIGQPIETLSLSKAAGVMMIPVPADGVLKRVEGVTDAQAVANVLEVRLDVREGEKLTQWPEGGKYPGFIYSAAESAQQVEAALREAYSHLHFVCMPDFPVQISSGGSVLA